MIHSRYDHQRGLIRALLTKARLGVGKPRETVVPSVQQCSGYYLWPKGCGKGVVAGTWEKRKGWREPCSEVL